MAEAQKNIRTQMQATLQWQVDEIDAGFAAELCNTACRCRPSVRPLI